MIGKNWTEKQSNLDPFANLDPSKWPPNTEHKTLLGDPSKQPEHHRKEDLYNILSSKHIFYVNAQNIGSVRIRPTVIQTKGQEVGCSTEKVR